MPSTVTSSSALAETQSDGGPLAYVRTPARASQSQVTVVCALINPLAVC